MINTHDNFGAAPELVIGVVHDVFAHTGTYEVHLTGGGKRLATRLSEGSITPLGAHDIAQLQIGDPVVCLLPYSANVAYIIGVLPPQMFDPRFILPDSLVMRSCVGFFYSLLHKYVYSKDNISMANYSCGRPVDSLPGDWGHINEFGAAIWLGKFMTALRASDTAKIEAFWGDDLLRIFGYNLQQYTAAREHSCFDDEGEYSEVEQWTPYMWEALGAYKPGTAVFEEHSGASGGIKQGNENCLYEPKEEKQCMVMRGLLLRGYLGDCKKEIVTLPPVDGEDIAKRDDEKNLRGVLEVHYGVDGAYHVRSAKEILLEKSIILPVPRQLLDADDPSGDTGAGLSANYKPANQYGSGPTQEQKPFEWQDNEPPARICNLWEYQAYLFGKFGLQVIDAHEKDWKAPEESELKIDDSQNNELDDKVFTHGGDGLKFNPQQDLPDFGTVKIDQRDGYSARYYKTRAFFQIMDDGSMVLEDGYGSQLIMSGGNIYMACQGDIFNRPGRSFITWAPRDIIARAGWCNELSAAKGDIRVKSENNMHLLAGDGEKGCVLIECRATDKPSKAEWDGKYGEEIESRGVIIKAEDSAIDVWSKNAFIGTSKDEDGVVEISSGNGRTVIDGGTVGIEAKTKLGVIVGPGRSQSSCPAASMIVAEPGALKVLGDLDVVGDMGLWRGCAGSGNLEMDGSVKVKGDVGAVGSMYCDGSVAANGVRSNDIHNATGGGRAPDISSRGGETTASVEAAKQPLYREFEEDTLDDADTGAGNKEVRDAIGFSFRKSDQYKAEDLKIFESRAQQLYRAHGLGDKWDEPVVEAPDGTETRPHPGNDTWIGGDSYKYIDPGVAKNLDYATGVAKARDAQTEQGPAVKDAALENEYIVTVQEE